MRQICDSSWYHYSVELHLHLPKMPAGDPLAPSSSSAAGITRKSVIPFFLHHGVIECGK